MSSWPNLFKVVISGNFDKNLCDKYINDITKTSSHFSSVLHFAIIGGNIDTLKYLLSHGAEVNIKNQYCESPLHWCCKVGNIKLAKILIKYGADTTCLDFDENSPLHWAAEYNQHEIVSYLLSLNVPFDDRNVYLQTPSNLAALNSSLESLSLLKSHKLSHSKSISR